MAKATCRWPGCDRPAKSFGLCNRDDQRARQCGNKVDPWRTWAPKKPKYHVCRWLGCDRTDLIARGMCGPHYDRGRLLGDFDRPWESWYEDRICDWCRTKFTAPVSRDTRCCSWPCSTALWKTTNPDRVRRHNVTAARKRRARKRAAPYEVFTNEDVRARDGDVCYLCDEAIDFELSWPHLRSPSLDHIVPLARGGTHTLDNSAMTHLDCNRRKFVNEPKSVPVGIGQ